MIVLSDVWISCICVNIEKTATMASAKKEIEDMPSDLDQAEEEEGPGLLFICFWNERLFIHSPAAAYDDVVVVLVLTNNCYWQVVQL